MHVRGRGMAQADAGHERDHLAVLAGVHALGIAKVGQQFLQRNGQVHLVEDGEHFLVLEGLLLGHLLLFLGAVPLQVGPAR